MNSRVKFSFSLRIPNSCSMPTANSSEATESRGTRSSRFLVAWSSSRDGFAPSVLRITFSRRGSKSDGCEMSLLKLESVARLDQYIHPVPELPRLRMGPDLLFQRGEEPSAVVFCRREVLRSGLQRMSSPEFDLAAPVVGRADLHGITIAPVASEQPPAYCSAGPLREAKERSFEDPHDPADGIAGGPSPGW